VTDHSQDFLKDVRIFFMFTLHLKWITYINSTSELPYKVSCYIEVIQGVPDRKTHSVLSMYNGRMVV